MSRQTQNVFNQTGFVGTSTERASPSKKYFISLYTPLRRWGSAIAHNALVLIAVWPTRFDTVLFTCKALIAIFIPTSTLAYFSQPQTCPCVNETELVLHNHSDKILQIRQGILLVIRVECVNCAGTTHCSLTQAH